jgi:hypothetical protein
MIVPTTPQCKQRADETAKMLAPQPRQRISAIGISEASVSADVMHLYETQSPSHIEMVDDALNTAINKKVN